MEQEVIYRIALSRLKGINKALAQHIHETVESLETFFELPESQLQKITGIKGRILHEDNRQTALQEARKEMNLSEKGASNLSISQSRIIPNGYSIVSMPHPCSIIGVMPI